MNYDQVEALSTLLTGGAEREDNHHHSSREPVVKNNPNAGQDPLFRTVIKSGPSAPATASTSKPAAPRIDSRAIWSADEIEQAKDLTDDDIRDDRIKPDYDIFYKQSLSASDVFMNMSLKDGSTQHCEAIVVKIPMPGVRALSELTLEVTATRLVVQSEKYRLFLHLPHTVNEAQGRAAWDGKKETLAITLPIVKNEDEI